MTIPRFGSNPTQLQMQMHHMQPMSSGLQLQRSPFDASAGDTYAKDSGVPQLVASPGRRGFLATGLGLALLAGGCASGSKGKDKIAAKPSKDPKTLRQDQATPVTLPPDGIGDVDSFETLASSDGGRGVFSKSSSFPLWGKAGIIGGGVVGAALVLWGATVLFVRRSNKAGQARREQIDDDLMAANEYHDLGPKGIQVRYKQTDGALATDIIKNSDNMVFVRLLEKNRPLFPRNPLKWRKWRSGELKRCTFRIDDMLDEMGVTNDSERDDIRSFVNTAIGQGWIREVPLGNRKTGIIEGKAHEFFLTPYKEKKQKKVAAPDLQLLPVPPAPETVSDTGDQDAGGQPQVTIDQHALVKVDGEGYYIYAEGQLRRLYPEVWQGKVIERISAPDIKNGPTRKHLYTEVAKPVDKSVTQDMVNQLLRDIGSTGILAPNSEIHDEFLIVAPLAPKDKAEAKLYDNRGTILFEVSNAQPSQDDGQPSQKSTLASDFDAEPSADGSKKLPYYMGEDDKITKIKTTMGTINVPEAWQKALSFCADTGGCSTRDLVKAYDAFKSEEMLDFQDYVESSEALLFIKFSGELGNDTPIKITIPSEADALALDTDEKATKAGVKPPSLSEAIAAKGSYTDVKKDKDVDVKDLIADAAAAKLGAGADPSLPPPRDAGRQRVERPLKKVESDQTVAAFNKPPSPTPEAAEEAAPPADAALGNELEFSFPGDSENASVGRTFTDVKAAILRLTMFKPFVGDIGEHLASLDATIDAQAANEAKISLVGDDYLEETDEGLRVREPLVEYFDIERPEPEAKAAPNIVAEPEVVEKINPEDIVEISDAEAAPDIAVEAETQELDIVDITFVSDVETAQAEVEAARVALTAVMTESSQATASLEAATQALIAAKAAAAEANAEARAKANAIFKAVGEEEEEQAEQEEAEAQDIYAQKKVAWAEKKEDVIAARAVLEETNARWNKAEEAKETALSALEEAQAKEAAEAAAQAKAAAEAKAKAALLAEPDVTDPVQAAQAMYQEKMKAKKDAETAHKQAKAEHDQAFASAKAAAKAKETAESELRAAKVVAQAKSAAVFEAVGEEAEERAEREEAEARKMFAQKKAASRKAVEAMDPVGERLQKAKADLETAKEDVEKAERAKLKAAAAEAKTEEEALAAEAEKIHARFSEENTDPDTLVRNDSEPTLHAGSADGAKTQRFTRKEVTDESRKAGEKETAVQSALDTIKKDGSIVVPAVIGRALKKRLKAEFESNTSGGQMTLTLKASEAEVHRAYDRLMDDDDGTITTSAVIGRVLEERLTAEGEEFETSTSGGQMTITLKD